MGEGRLVRMYRVNVRPLPNFEAMEARFGKGQIVNLTSDDSGRWVKDPSRGKEEGECDQDYEALIVAKPLGSMESEEELVRWAKEHSCVPCNRREVYAFAVADATHNLPPACYFAFGESFFDQTGLESIPVFVKNPEEGDQLGLGRRYTLRFPSDRFLFKKNEKKS